ncbi:MAG: class I adenylate-forming enzyme family protein [Acidimicrobiales bacterium]
MQELVALDIPPGEAFVDAMLSAWDQGDAVAPLDPRLPRPAVDDLIELLKPSRIVGVDGDGARLDRGLPIQEGDALVMATSGSTGRPKAVVLTHESLLASARATSRRLTIDSGRHTWLACLPFAHIGGLAVAIRALLTETPVVILPRFEREEVEMLAGSGRVSHVSLVASTLKRVDPDLFERILLGGSAPLSRLPRNTVTTYGMTETGSGIVYDGEALDGVEIAIESTDSSPDGSGEILVKAPMLFRGYRDGKDPFVSGPDGKRGWFPTGDGGRIAPTGKLKVFGRLAGVIVSGGEKVWPESVETVISTHHLVDQVAVWKRPDPEWGERVVAWVVPSDLCAPPPVEELRELVAQRLAPWAAPKEVEFVASIPRTPSGKPRRNELR